LADSYNGICKAIEEKSDRRASEQETRTYFVGENGGKLALLGDGGGIL